MNLKNEKGITLVLLIITIIIMMILVGVTVHFSNDAIDKATLEDIKTDMISIKTRAKIIAEQYNFKDIDALVGSTITDEEAQKLDLTNSDKILKWSSSDLASQNLGAIEGDTYVVSYDLDEPNKCEVYYLKGYEGEYSLSDLKDL
jgi:Tfp pilus assembly protein PilE